jgi:CDP-glucose 4,6-dehydratase
MTRAGMWHRRRVLVTGCTGLLGSWLTDWLVRQQADVVGLVRDEVPPSNFHRLGLDRRITAVRGCVEDFDLVERALNEYEIEVVFHLAAQAIVGIANENPRSSFSSNIAGTWTVLEACRLARRVRAIVVASSDKAYGAQSELPYRETAPLEGRHPYDVSKSCADLIAQAYWHSYRVPVGITRCGNFFGGGDLNFNRIVPGTIRSLYDRQPVIIRSDGAMRRDYIYVQDAVLAYTVLAERLSDGQAHGQAFNFSNEAPLTVLEMAARIGRLMGHDRLKPVIRNEATNEIQDQFLSARKARRELGWRPRYTVEEGLRETIAWYEAWFKELEHRGGTGTWRNPAPSTPRRAFAARGRRQPLHAGRSTASKSSR